MISGAQVFNQAYRSSIANLCANGFKNNLTRAKPFRQQIEKTLLDYHNRLIDAKEVNEQMIAIRREMEFDDQRAQELGLTPEEIAFSDVVTGNFITIYDQIFLSDLVHAVVQTLQRNLKVDWTEPHAKKSEQGCGRR